MLNWTGYRKLLMLNLVLAIAAAGMSCSSTDRLPASSPKYETAAGFPLKAGTYWVYTGIVKWQDGHDTRETKVTWRMEVVRTEHVGRYEVSILEGHPSDLAFFTPGKPRGGHIFVQDEGRFYEVGSIKDFDDLLADEKTLKSHLGFDSLFLELPLQPGSCLGQDPEHQRTDIMYCWSVGAPKPIALDGVKGIPSGGDYLEYELAYRSNPDHTFVYFVPGVGITSFIYGHHGTASEVDVHLIEYHPG